MEGLSDALLEVNAKGHTSDYTSMLTNTGIQAVRLHPHPSAARYAMPKPKQAHYIGTETVHQPAGALPYPRLNTIVSRWGTLGGIHRLAAKVAKRF